MFLHSFSCEGVVLSECHPFYEIKRNQKKFNADSKNNFFFVIFNL